MGAFFLRRLITLVPVLVGVTVVVFISLHLVPGNPSQLLLGPLATRAQLAAISRQLGLNQPLPVQYIRWMGQVLHGKLGFSIFFHQSVDSLHATGQHPDSGPDSLCPCDDCRAWAGYYRRTFSGSLAGSRN